MACLTCFARSTLLVSKHKGEPKMLRTIVVCPACELHFLSSRPKTYCPGCHALVEPGSIS